MTDATIAGTIATIDATIVGTIGTAGTTAGTTAATTGGGAVRRGGFQTGRAEPRRHLSASGRLRMARVFEIFRELVSETGEKKRYRRRGLQHFFLRFLCGINIC